MHARQNHSVNLNGFRYPDKNYLINLKCKTEPFVSHKGSRIYICRAIKNLTATLSRNISQNAGLQYVIGEGGAGKTTLLNELVQKFSEDKNTVVLLIEDPRFKNLEEFLISLAGIFQTIKAPLGFDDNTFQMAFASYFYKLCLRENKTVLLLIDNGQNLPDFCLDALNVFYDHHQDYRRFLQTVICGEVALQLKINAKNALKSKVFFNSLIEPFKFADTRSLIRYHLEQAAVDPNIPPTLFSLPAVWIIYKTCRGHPRKTIDLCFMIVLSLVIEGRKKADLVMAQHSATQLFPNRAKQLQVKYAALLTFLISCIMVVGFWSIELGLRDIARQVHYFSPALPEVAQPLISQPLQTAKDTRETSSPEQMGETTPADSGTIADSDTPEKFEEPIIPDLPQKEQVLPGETTVPEVLSEILSDIPSYVPDKRVKPPEQLGVITTAPGETFGDMVRRIYGPWSFNPENIKTVLAANPGLENPELLQVGQQIRFPAIPVVMTPRAEEVWWVRVDTFDTIQSAYRFLRKYKNLSTPMLIIPSRENSDQVVMNILLQEFFPEKESAEKAVRDIHNEISAKAEIVHGLNPAFFYYEVEHNDSKAR